MEGTRRRSTEGYKGRTEMFNYGGALYDFRRFFSQRTFSATVVRSRRYPARPTMQRCLQMVRPEQPYPSS